MFCARRKNRFRFAVIALKKEKKKGSLKSMNLSLIAQDRTRYIMFKRALHDNKTWFVDLFVVCVYFSCTKNKKKNMWAVFKSYQKFNNPIVLIQFTSKFQPHEYKKIQRFLIRFNIFYSKKKKKYYKIEKEKKKHH